MQEPLVYDVDIGECLDIATMESTTIKADQLANKRGYYMSSQGSSSSSGSKSKKQADRREPCCCRTRWCPVPA